MIDEATIKRVGLECGLIKTGRKFFADEIERYGFDKLESYSRAIEQLARQEQQAKIDALMLEYCPDEMTQEQIAQYEQAQVQSNSKGEGK